MLRKSSKSRDGGMLRIQNRKRGRIFIVFLVEKNVVLKRDLYAILECNDWGFYRKYLPKPQKLT